MELHCKVRLACRDGMNEPAAARLPSVRRGREDRLTLWRLGPEEHSGNDSGHRRRGPNRRRSRSAYGSRAVRRPSYGFVPSCRGLGFRTGCLRLPFPVLSPEVPPTFVTGRQHDSTSLGRTVSRRLRITSQELLDVPTSHSRDRAALFPCLDVDVIHSQFLSRQFEDLHEVLPLDPVTQPGGLSNQGEHRSGRRFPDPPCSRQRVLRADRN